MSTISLKNQAKFQRLTEHQDTVILDDGTKSVGNCQQGTIIELFLNGSLDFVIGSKINTCSRYLI
jgi:hypothetical protein